MLIGDTSSRITIIKEAAYRFLQNVVQNNLGNKDTSLCIVIKCKQKCKNGGFQHGDGTQKVFGAPDVLIVDGFFVLSYIWGFGMC